MRKRSGNRVIDVGALARAVQNRASVATHVPQTAQEVRRTKRYLDVVLFYLLEIT